MIDMRTYKDLNDLEVLPKGKLYIYIMLNDAGKVKIGKTHNIYKRYLSLCGSNGQGNKILKVYVSSSTYLYTIESIMHNKFNKYRIKGTEWFSDKNDSYGNVLYEKAVDELELLFSSDNYDKNNELRKSIYRKKSGDINDN